MHCTVEAAVDESGDFCYILVPCGNSLLLYGYPFFFAVHGAATTFDERPCGNSLLLYGYPFSLLCCMGHGFEVSTNGAGCLVALWGKTKRDHVCESFLGQELHVNFFRVAYFALPKQDFFPYSCNMCFP